MTPRTPSRLPTRPLKETEDMAMSTDEWIDELKAISVLELSERIKALEETFGVSAAAAAAPAAAAPAAAAAVEEKTSFTVTLESSGDKKIQVIKVVRAVTGLGLKEAKDIADGAPGMVKEGVPTADAEKMKAELVEAGATVELR